MLSRVADSLYWMNRYVERAEHTTRLIAVKLESMLEQSHEDADSSWRRVVAALSNQPLEQSESDPMAIAQYLAFDRFNESALISSLRNARDNARQAREQLSTEVWERLNCLYLRLQPATTEWMRVHHPARLFREVLEDLQTLEGVTYSTISHGEGWYFLELGRYIERAQLLSRLLSLHYGENMTDPKYYDWLVLLKLCTAFEPYCKTYTAAIRPEKIAEFLLFDPEFPHSVRFAVGRVTDALEHVAPGAALGRRVGVERLAGRLKANVNYGRVDDLKEHGAIASFLADVRRQCKEIHDAVNAAYITYGAETVL